MSRKVELKRVADFKDSAVFHEEVLMMRVQHEIETLMAGAGMNQDMLGSKLGVKKSTVSRLLDPDRNLTLRSLARIAFVLGSEVTPTMQPISGREDVPSTQNLVYFTRYKADFAAVGCQDVALGECGT